MGSVRLAEQIWIAIEMLLPNLVTQDHYASAAGCVFGLGEDAPQCRRHTERRKKVRGHITPDDAFRLTRASQHEAF